MNLILVVEDDKYLNEVIQEVLIEEGYKIESALSAVDALIKIEHQEKKYQVVILDYNLFDKHGINGIDIFERAKELNPDVRGIMISAYGEKFIREMSRKKGIDIFIDKPFLVSDFVNSVHSLTKQ